MFGYTHGKSHSLEHEDEAVMQILEHLWNQLNLEKQLLHRALTHINKTKRSPRVAGFFGRKNEIDIFIENIDGECIYYILLFFKKST